jgi:hypothetical protein
MSFKPLYIPGGIVPAVEYFPAEAITPKAGLLLGFDTSSHQLQAATTAAQYISVMETAAAVTAGDIIPVIPINKDTIYVTQWDGTTTLDKGETCDIDSTSLLADANGTANDDLLIIGMDGTAAGDNVYVKFVK